MSATNVTGIAERYFASNDLMAIGVLGALQNHGLRIPQDISVIGYDDV